VADGRRSEGEGQGRTSAVRWAIDSRGQAGVGSLHKASAVLLGLPGSPFRRPTFPHSFGKATPAFRTHSTLPARRGRLWTPSPLQTSPPFCPWAAFPDASRQSLVTHSARPPCATLLTHGRSHSSGVRAARLSS
jgi:hypothetical protein